MSSFVT
ncbi:RNA polymerase subunit RPO18, partial [Monkeypox virus]